MDQLGHHQLQIHRKIEPALGANTYLNYWDHSNLDLTTPCCKDL